MPSLPLRPCLVAGCPVLGRCPTHTRPKITAEQPRLYDDRRGSSAQRGYGYAWQKRRAAFIQQYPYCKRCAKPTTDVDHIIPRARGGSDDDHNLQPLCSFHHKQKTAREKTLFGQRERRG